MSWLNVVLTFAISEDISAWTILVFSSWLPSAEEALVSLLQLEPPRANPRTTAAHHRSCDRISGDEHEQTANRAEKALPAAESGEVASGGRKRARGRAAKSDGGSWGESRRRRIRKEGKMEGVRLPCGNNTVWPAQGGQSGRGNGWDTATSSHSFASHGRRRPLHRPVTGPPVRVPRGTL